MLNHKLLYTMFGIVISAAVAIALVSIVRANDSIFLPLLFSSRQNTSDSIVIDASQKQGEIPITNTIEPSDLYYIIPRDASDPTPTPSGSENRSPIEPPLARASYSEVVDMAPKVSVTEKALLVFNDGSGGLKAVLVTPDMINTVVNEIGKELLVNLIPPESAFANRVPRVEVPVGTPQVYEKTPGEVPNLPLSTPNPPTQ